MIRLAISGAAGYLGKLLIRRCRQDSTISYILALDHKIEGDLKADIFLQLDVRDRRLSDILKEHQIDTFIHLAWKFDPTHNPEEEYEVDVLGSRNAFAACAEARIKRIIYLGSTTAYGPYSDNPIYFNESYPIRGHPKYTYSKYKAIVDLEFTQFMIEHPDIVCILLRAPIVFGPNLRGNIVAYILDLPWPLKPFMFQIAGYDPPFQFIHEEDMIEFIHRSLKPDRSAIVNVSGEGIIRYSEIITRAGKIRVPLPAWILYPLVGLLWQLRLLKMPASLLDFIRYPWVAKSDKAKEIFGWQPSYSSVEALDDYLSSRRT